LYAGPQTGERRVLDAESGKQLWEAQLPASGNATPMTYSMHGKQYLVIAAGGHPKITEEASSDKLISQSAIGSLARTQRGTMQEIFFLACIVGSAASRINSNLKGRH
jgi:hypothetical protein